MTSGNIICKTKTYPDLTYNRIYEIWNGNEAWNHIYIKNDYGVLNMYDKSFFISVGEHREKQIEKII